MIQLNHTHTMPLELKQDSFARRSNCPYCRVVGEKKGPVYLPNFFTFPAGRVKVNKDLHRLIELRRCPRCGLLYKDHVVTQELQSHIYQESESRYHYKSANKYITRKLEFIKRLYPDNGARLLDIGCHTGDFLKLAKSAGFRTSGADCSDTANTHHGDFVDDAFYYGLLEDIQMPGNYFDVITAWDVFEHFYDLNSALGKMYAALKPGGYLCFETGNVSSLGAKLRSANYWWYVCGLTHFNFFDRDCAEYILNDAGFSVITARKTYHKSIADMSIAQFSKQVFKSSVFYLSPEFYKYAANIKNKSGGGVTLPWKDHIFIVARKNDLQGSQFPCGKSKLTVSTLRRDAETGNFNRNHDKRGTP